VVHTLSHVATDIDFWDLGRLLRADRWAFADDGETDPDWLVAVEFMFENGTIVVEAVPEDDTISVHTGALEHWSGDAVRVAESHRARGCAVQRAWFLTNNRGYRDGFQISFHSGKVEMTLQFVTIASRLVEYLVETAAPSPSDLG
jgi:hypothetical protein